MTRSPPRLSPAVVTRPPDEREPGGAPRISPVTPGPIAYWLTGLSGAGKTTFGLSIQRELDRLRIASSFLDGDELRRTISADLGFSESDRAEHARRTVEYAMKIALAGICPIL